MHLIIIAQSDYLLDEALCDNKRSNTLKLSKSDYNYEAFDSGVDHRKLFFQTFLEANPRNEPLNIFEFKYKAKKKRKLENSIAVTDVRFR